MALAILSLDAVSKQYTERPLLRDATLAIAAGERVGVVGVNGSGKTTLLRIAAGAEPPDSGRVSKTRGLRIAYLPQNPALNADLTVLAQLFQDDTPALRLVRSYAEVTDALAHAPDDAALQQRLGELVSQLDAADAWGVEHEARTILTRLGITDLHALVGTLSGGQRKRVAMAAALINPVDLLILDEPTNHIDTDTIAWLEEFLARSTAALLLVTHDRYVLDRVCQRIVEVDQSQLYSYVGGYSRFLEQKAERLNQQASGEARRQTILRKELVWLRRGARARTTKQQARIGRIADMQAIDAPQQQGSVAISSVARRLGKKVFELKAVSKRYGPRQLVNDLTLSIAPGDRVGIIGVNGSGKTTLLNMIAGRLVPDSGTIEVGETVRLAYYDQESAGLDPAQRVIDYIQAGAEVTSTAEGGLITAGQLLERFLFPPAAQYSLVGTLSGGERRRLYLLRQLIDAPNVLLLDEPTNDLDIQTLTVLEDYLDDFAGTVVVVSHDRYFLDRTVERTLAFADGAITEYPGGYSAYAEALAQEPPAPPERPKPKPAPAAATAAPAKPRKLSHAEARELRALETQIAALETEQARIGAAVNASAADYQRTAALSAELATVEATLETAFTRWAALAEIAEG